MKLTLDQKMLLFIWKWKLCTASSLYVKFMPNLQANTAYKRIDNLKKRGLICLQSDKAGEVSPWTLTKKGFESIKSLLPDLAEEGFQSETLIHDQLVTAIHLGEWLVGLPEGCELITEQELRRIHPEHYPNWVPQSKVHRPDGYWYIGGNENVIALELEISRKQQDLYISICQFYKKQSQISMVVWVVNNKSQAHGLHSLFEEWGAKDKHQFIFLSAIHKLGWKAPIVIGSESGKTLSQILVKNASKTHQNFDFSILLDSRKFPKLQPVKNQA
ncbi:MAG: hypothetical protein KBD78_14930 [Oligoflexales bacterium]|nr:hypothetical protein [Oligoflexales bacterium]